MAKEEGEEKWPSSSATHISTQETGCAVDSHQLPQHFHPCSSTTLCRVCRDRKCHNTHTRTGSDIQAYSGLSCHAELPVCAKDNWPNGLSLPHWLNMEWGDCSPPSSEYWLVALLIIRLWNKQFFTPHPQGSVHLTPVIRFWPCNFNTRMFCTMLCNVPQ